jgi:TRAP-type C4-dicarboxylate transport system permease small subunit
MLKVLKKTDEILARILRGFVTGLFVGLGLVLFLRVLIRFTPLHISLSWTDEVVEWMMAWMIFTAATLIMRSGDHFRVDLLQTKYEGRAWVNVLNVFISLLGLLFFASLLYYSIRLTAGATWFSPILKVSTRVPYLSIPVNCVLILFYLLRDLVVGIHAFKKLRPVEPKAVKNEAA